MEAFHKYKVLNGNKEVLQNLIEIKGTDPEIQDHTHA